MKTQKLCLLTIFIYIFEMGKYHFINFLLLLISKHTSIYISWQNIISTQKQEFTKLFKK